MNELDKSLTIALGVTMRDKGVLQRSYFNNLISNDKVGYEKLNKEEFKSFVASVDSSEELHRLYEEAVNGMVTVADITPAIERLSGMTEEDVLPAISPAVHDKMELQSMLTAFKRFQKQGVAQENIARKVSQGLENILPNIETKRFESLEKLPTLDNDMIVQLSDWHIGALIDVDGNMYSYDIAKRRLRYYLDEVARQYDVYRPKHVYITHVGDFIEHVSMRMNDQAYNAEFLSSEQIARVIKMFTETIIEIAGYAKEVSVVMVGGNHDRMQGNKSEGINGDSAAYIVLQQMLLLASYGVLGDNVNIVDNSQDIYNAEIVVANNRYVMVTHGDTLQKGKPATKTLMTTHPIDLVLLGHYHYFNATQEALGSQTIMGGSLQGYNSYSQRLHTPNSMASQNIIIMPYGDNPTITITPVMLP